MRNKLSRLHMATVGVVALFVFVPIAAAQESAIRKLISEDYDKAENAQDVSAKMRLYAADAVLLPPEGSPVSGDQAIRAWHERTYKQAKFQGSSTVEEVQTFGEWGFGRGTYAGTVTPVTSGSPSKIRGKFLVMVKRQPDGNWKIVREIWNLEPPPQKTSD